MLSKSRLAIRLRSAVIPELQALAFLAVSLGSLYYLSGVEGWRLVPQFTAMTVVIWLSLRLKHKLRSEQPLKSVSSGAPLAV